MRALMVALCIAASVVLAPLWAPLVLTAWAADILGSPVRGGASVCSVAAGERRRRSWCSSWSVRSSRASASLPRSRQEWGNSSTRYAPRSRNRDLWRALFWVRERTGGQKRATGRTWCLTLLGWGDISTRDQISSESFLKDCPNDAVVIYVTRVKSTLVLVWITLGLVALGHGPLDALGGFADSLSCMAGVAVMGNSGGLVQADDSYDESACRLINRTKSIAPVSIAKFGFSCLTRWPMIQAIKQKKPDGELSFVLSNWQFLRRAALFPRAPDSLA